MNIRTCFHTKVLNAWPLALSACVCIAPMSVDAGVDRGPMKLVFKTPESRQFQVVSPLGFNWVLPWDESGSDPLLTPELLGSDQDPFIYLTQGAPWEGSAILRPTSRWVLAIDDVDKSEAVLRSTLSTAPWTPGFTEERFPGVWVIHQKSAMEAVLNSDYFASKVNILASYPIWINESIKSRTKYEPLPDDELFASNQWNLDSRDSNKRRQPGGLNVRGAWPQTLGAGARVAIVDDGIEMDHPDLVDRLNPGASYNFISEKVDGNPTSILHDHGTAVAGLVAATMNNEIGIAGVAPEAELVSWQIVDDDGTYAATDQLSAMFEYEIEETQVQNHSWGPSIEGLSGPTFLERFAITHAVENGRNGKGVVLVRAAGNDRAQRFNVNQDGYANSPESITVAATLKNGRVASYSNPGSTVLVAAPGADFGDSPFATTDRQGTLGYNWFNGTRGDYVTSGFVGTSAATPQISGLVALILSMNPELGYRDVQQILALASRISDRSDPDIVVNGVGLEISHNVGYGVPDAGLALLLAQSWTPRSALETLSFSNTLGGVIPDAGFVLETRRADGSPILNVPSEIQVRSSDGIFPAHSTAWMSLGDIGHGATTPVQDLTGKVALIERGVRFISDQLQTAESFGAELAVIFNQFSFPEWFEIQNADRAYIPAVAMKEADGLALRAALQQFGDVEARIQNKTYEAYWDVENSLSCEFVGVRLRTNHLRRGDLRLELVSPSGVVSVLQTRNFDESPGPLDWTYYSVRHFYENSKGRWTLRVLDEVAGNAGFVFESTLIIRGVSIEDTDLDGLPDSWENSELAGLEFNAYDDPDLDGFTNLMEWLLKSPPLTNQIDFHVTIQAFDGGRFRISWPGRTGANYLIDRSRIPQGPYSQPVTIPGVFPETEWIFQPLNNPIQWFRWQEDF